MNADYPVVRLPATGFQTRRTPTATLRQLETGFNATPTRDQAVELDGSVSVCL